MLKMCSYDLMFKELLIIKTKFSEPNRNSKLYFILCSVRTNSKFWNEPNTKYLFDSKN